jgi:hypothetical protein
MKTPNPDNPIRNTLKHLAVGVAAAAAFFTTGPAAKANVTYDFSTGVQSWTKIHPVSGDLWAADFGWPKSSSKGHLGAGWDDADTQMGRSPEFKLNGTGDLTFQTFGSKSPLAAVGVTPSTIPATAIVGGGFCGLALRDVAADAYVLSKGQSEDNYSDPAGFTTLSFTAAELAPYRNDGKLYTLDWIDYDKAGGGGWGWLVNVSIPTLKTACDITAFGTNVAGSSAVITTTSATEGTVEWTVPFGTTVASLAPIYTLSSGATCSQTSGAIPTPPLSTTTTVSYLVTAEDGATKKDYAVTVVVAPPSDACDITAFGTNVAGSSAVITDDFSTGTVAWTVLPGTDLATLAPTFTLSLAATCNRTSGAVPTPDFSTGPLHYLVTAQDGSTTKDYTVTVTIIPSLPVTADLTLHLDALQLTGLSDGATVPTWTDMSGLGNHATAAGTPIYKTGGLNGRPVVRFNGASSFTTADLSSQFPTTATVFLVTTLSNDNAYTLVKANPGVDEWWRYDGNGNSYPGVFRGNRLEAYCPMPNSGSHLFAVSSSASAWEMAIDGASKGVAGGNYNAGGALVIGNGSSGGGLNGDIAEVIIYNRTLTAGEADQVGAYLATKYGLTTNYGLPPTVSGYAPPVNGTSLPASNLELTFNEPIAIGTGNITIRNTDSSPDPEVVIDVTDTNQVSISGSTLTINPTSDLVLDKNYAVLIDAGAIKDLSEVPFAGISDLMTWNFTIVPPVAPPTLPPVTDGMIVWLPADGVSANDSTQVRIDGADTFVKQWKDLSGNNKHASNTTPNDQPRFIASGLNGKPVLRFGQDGNGDRLKLGDLSASFPTGASVFVVATIANDGRYNLFGNRNNDERWVADTWGESRPGSFRGGRSQSATFTLSDWPQTGSHVFSLESNSSKFEVLINGASIGTDSANYHSGAGSDWTIGDSAANNDQRLNGDVAEVILYNRVLSAGEADQVGAYLATKYGLTTIYGPPTVLSYTPPDGGTTAATSDLVLTFNKPIAIGTGNITLKNLTDSTQTVIPIDDTQVSISGAVLTINPMDDLVLGKDYAVQIDAGAIKALSDAPFAGILDDTTWNFATAPPTATTTMVVASVSPTIYGESVAFTATVSPIPSGGTVQFFSDVFGNLGTPVAVNTTTGEATYTTTTLGAGTHKITAEYSGNYQFTGSSTATPISQEVGKAPLIVKAVDVFRPLNTANPDPLPYQITGFKNGQNLASSGVSGTPVLSTDAVLASPVGDYPITCTVPPEMSADNYSFTAEDGILTVANVADTFSVNFYSFGGLNTVEQQANVLISPGQPAGLGGWLTPGWRNVDVPWGGGLQPAVTLTSNMASTSTFLFKDCRNGWSSWGEPRTTNLGVGNYNMMGAGVNSTLDPIADPAKFDMEMTNIPFGTYDVIFYFRANQPQYGDGTGVIKFNGGADRAFKLKSGAFDGNFIEMVDATTEGNYIVFTGVTGSSFTVQTWGTGPNGFNHLGPAGFQIRRVAGPLYSTWAAANAPGQAAGEDYDNDGVENGIEYFMGETGSSFTAMPGLDATNKVSWTMDPNYEGTYEVQTSPDLATWTNVDPRPTPSGGSLSYTLPTGLGKQFVRLLVTPAP